MGNAFLVSLLLLTAIYESLATSFVLSSPVGNDQHPRARDVRAQNKAMKADDNSKSMVQKSLQTYHYSPIYSDLTGKFVNRYQYVYCPEIWVDGSLTQEDPNCSPCNTTAVETIKLGSCINQYYKNSLTDAIEFFSYKIDGSVDQYNLANFTFSEYDGKDCMKSTPWQYTRYNQGTNWWGYKFYGAYNVTLTEPCGSNTVTITDNYVDVLSKFKKQDLVAVNATYANGDDCQSKSAVGIIESRARSIDENEFKSEDYVNGEFVPQYASPEDAVCQNPWLKGKNVCEQMHENYLIRNDYRVNQLQCSDYASTSKMTQGNPTGSPNLVCASGSNCRGGAKVFILDDRVTDPFIVKASDCKTDLKKPLVVRIMSTYLSYREDNGEVVGSVDLYYEFPKKEDPNVDSDYGSVDMFLAAKVFSSTKKGKTHKLRLGKGGDALPDDPVRSMYWFQISANDHSSRVGVKTLEFVAYLPPDQMDASMDSFRVKIKQGKNIVLGCKMYSQMNLPASDD